MNSRNRVIMLAKRSIYVKRLIKEVLARVYNSEYYERYGCAVVIIHGTKTINQLKLDKISEIVKKKYKLYRIEYLFNVSKSQNSAQIASNMIWRASQSTGKIPNLALKTLNREKENYRGIFIRVSGKIYGARHRSVKYISGNDRKTGHYLNKMSNAVREQINTPQGVIGLYIRVLDHGPIPGTYEIRQNSINSKFELKQI